MKRPLWSILTAAVAALLPGMTVPSQAAAVAAPVPEALGPAPEAVQVRRPEIRTDERQLDERDDEPAPIAEIAVTADPVAAHDVVATVAVHSASPDVAPRARRSLGRPRVRAPDCRTV